MSTFLKAAAVTLTALILWVCLNKYNKDMSLLLSLAVCGIVLVAAFAVMEPVIDFIERLQQTGKLDSDLLQIILKAVGIGFLGEMCGELCKDAGNATMGKALQISAAITILWLSLPVFEKLLTLLETIMGSV